mgnify:CR=1 FL=1
MPEHYGSRISTDMRRAGSCRRYCRRVRPSQLHCRCRPSMVQRGRLCRPGMIQSGGHLFWRGGSAKPTCSASKASRCASATAMPKTREFRARRLPGADFLWLLLAHVLPRGFRRCRSYGLLRHRRSDLLQRVQLMLRVVLPPAKQKTRSALLCKHCGQQIGSCAHGPRKRQTPTASPRRYWSAPRPAWASQGARKRAWRLHEPLNLCAEFWGNASRFHDGLTPR